MRIAAGMLISVVALLMTLPSVSEAARPWFARHQFRKSHPGWSAKFRQANRQLKRARHALKRAGKKADAGLRQAMAQAETAWLKLHVEWKKHEVERNNRSWDKQVANIKAAMEAKKVNKNLLDARMALWNAQLAWIEANRTWRKVESEYHLKTWAERLEKLAQAPAK